MIGGVGAFVVSRDVHTLGFELANEILERRRPEYLEHLALLWAHLSHQPQAAADCLLGKDLGRRRAGRRPSTTVTLRTSHPSRRTSTLTTTFDRVPRVVDLAGFAAQLVEVAFPDLAFFVGVDDQDFVRPSA